jgi:glycine cleavage system H lipoate-binding protein
MVKVQMGDPAEADALMSAEDYEAFVASEA